MKVLLSENSLVGADLDAWLENGGGGGLREALKQPDAILETVRLADLRGMGGAGFPTHRKWEFVRACESHGERYLVCNGNEDEPGTFKDRLLLEKAPHQLIEGALITALANRLNHIILYINPNQVEAVKACEQAVHQWRNHSLFQRVQPMELRVCLSSGRYIGGEETAAISSIEGGFPFPSRKPPFPTQSGIGGCPTLVNNVETLSHVTHIVKNGSEWYRGLGLGLASGMKLYSLSGDVMNAGVYELPLGTTLRDLIFLHGGGMLAGREFKAVFTGGPSNTLLTAEELDVPLDWDSVQEHRSRLGTGAMIVLSEGTGIVRRVTEYVNFFSEESCGQCPSCKIGLRQLFKLLQRIDTGRGSSTDLERLVNICKLLRGSGRCGLIDGAITVLESSLDKFRTEYEHLVSDRA